MARHTTKDWARGGGNRPGIPFPCENHLIAELVSMLTGLSAYSGPVCVLCAGQHITVNDHHPSL
jgi:hypothetical protein